MLYFYPVYVQNEGTFTQEENGEFREMFLDHAEVAKAFLYLIGKMKVSDQNFVLQDENIIIEMNSGFY